jgi:hypothetical protein
MTNREILIKLAEGKVLTRAENKWNLRMSEGGKVWLEMGPSYPPERFEDKFLSYSDWKVKLEVVCPTEKY